MPVAPPRLHLLRLSWTEYDRVAEWALRFVNPGSATHVRLARWHGGHRWICAEENIVGTIEVEVLDPATDPVVVFLGEAGRDHLDIPERLLAALPHYLSAEAEEIVLGFDPEAGTIELVGGLHDLSMTHVDAGAAPSWIGTGPGHVVQVDLAPVMALFGSRPVPVESENMPPFVRMVLAGARAEFSRDLTPWGLGVERVGVEADVQYRADLSFYAPAALAHLSALCDQDESVEMAFFFHRPLLVRFSQDDWTLYVLGGHRSVTVVRPRVVAALVAAGWNVNNDPDGGPTAVLEARRGDDRVDVRLLPVLGDSDAVVRVECTVVESVPWSEELGREIADLNAAWPGDKVLHLDGRLVVARDTSSAACGQLGRVADELLTRARALEEVVGVFF